MLSARTSRVQHFNTPKTTVWGHVSARSAVKAGTCKAIVCGHCEKEFAGGSLRITGHHAKCKSVPTHVREVQVGDDDSDDDPIDLRSVTATMGASTHTERDFSS